MGPLTAQAINSGQTSQISVTPFEIPQDNVQNIGVERDRLRLLLIAVGRGYFHDDMGVYQNV